MQFWEWCVDLFGYQPRKQIVRVRYGGLGIGIGGNTGELGLSGLADEHAGG